MATITCFEIKRSQTSSLATVEQLEKLLKPNNYLWVDSISLVNDFTGRDQLIKDFVLSLPDGLLYDSQSGSFHWTKKPDYLNTVLHDLTREILYIKRNKELMKIISEGSPLCWYRERICGWGEDFALFENEIFPMNDFLLYISGVALKNDSFSFGSVFTCHY